MADNFSGWCELDSSGQPDTTRCNPVKRYRTVSHHHIILVTNDADLQDAIATEIGVDFYNHPDNKDSSKQRFDVQYAKNGIPYVVLINGMTDAQFSISSYVIHSMVLPSEKTQQSQNIPGSALHGGGTLSIDEPFSANFLEVLSDIGSPAKLNTDTMNLTYFIKTFFVGTLDDGTVEQFGYVVPVAVGFMNISASFGSFGSTYFIELLPATNGMANHEYLATVGGITAKSAPTIGAGVKAMETVINSNLQKTAAEASPPRVPDIYTLHVDGAYSGLPLDNINTSNKDTDSNGNLILASEQGSSITTLLENIAKLSTSVVGMMQPDKTTGSFFLPSITSEVRLKNGKRYISYTLSPKQYYTLPPLIKTNCPSLADAQYEQLRAKRISDLIATLTTNNALVQYDYVFSGKNTDVTSFDMKLEYAFSAFLNERDESKPTSQSKQTTKPAPSPSTISQLPPSNGSCSLPSMATPKNGSTTAPNANKYLSFRALMNRNSQFQVSEAKLEILGNPLLLGGLVDPKFEKTGTINTLGVPAIVKVNVFMPQVDPNTGQPDPITLKTADQSFQSPFWFDGLFQILEIVHKFENGSFMQELSLTLLTTDDSLAIQSTTENKTAATSAGDGANRPASEPMAAGATKPKKDKGKCTVPKQVSDITNQTRAKNIVGFYPALRLIEGGNSYTADNGLYWGAYQMGASALVDAGYMKIVSGGTTGSVSWNGRYYGWTGVDGVNSLSEFKNNPAAQDKAIIAYHHRIWASYLKDYHQHAGTNIGGILLTQSGMIAAAHLVGHANVKKFINSGGKTVYMDGNCIPLTNYMECLGGKDVSVVINQPSILASASAIGKFIFTADVNTQLA